VLYLFKVKLHAAVLLGQEVQR